MEERKKLQWLGMPSVSSYERQNQQKNLFEGGGIQEPQFWSRDENEFFLQIERYLQNHIQSRSLSLLNPLAAVVPLCPGIKGRFV